MKGVSRHISSTRLDGQQWTFVEYHFGNMTRPRYENIDTLMGPALWSKVLRDVERLDIRPPGACDKKVKEEPQIKVIIFRR